MFVSSSGGWGLDPGLCLFRRLVLRVAVVVAVGSILEREGSLRSACKRPPGCTKDCSRKGCPEGGLGSCPCPDLRSAFGPRPPHAKLDLRDRGSGVGFQCGWILCRWRQRYRRSCRRRSCRSCCRRYRRSCRRRSLPLLSGGVPIGLITVSPAASSLRARLNEKSKASLSLSDRSPPVAAWRLLRPRVLFRYQIGRSPVQVLLDTRYFETGGVPGEEFPAARRTEDAREHWGVLVAVVGETRGRDGDDSGGFGVFDGCRWCVVV